MNCKSVREAIDTATRRSVYSETVRAHLHDCSDCRCHADEMSSLFALLSTQPRVEAPADFEFRVRARIARAKSEPKPAVGTLEKLWSSSFSFGQAATAMAAIAVAITASTVYFTHRDEITTTGENIAVTTIPKDLPVTIPIKSSMSNMDLTVPVKPAGRVAKSSSVKPTTANPRSQKTGVSQPVSVEPVVVAAAANSPKFFDRAKGQVIAPPERDFIGAEGARLTKSQTVPFTL